MLFETVSIVGVGLIGGSIAQAAKDRQLGRTIVGVGRHPEKLERARQRGLIDRWTCDLAEAATGSDLIVICSPVDRIAADVLQAANHARPGTLITDAGSTKGHIVRDVQASLAKGVEFVGAHPLAGSEKQGADYARGDLFQDRMCILTPVAATRPEAVERCTAFWSGLGCRIRLLSPEEHDLALATTSHGPHFVASLLAGMLPRDWREFAATGFRDTTRIAAGDPGLWSAIATENRLAIAHWLDELSARIDRFRSALLQEQADEIQRLLLEGKQVRDALGS